jgi:rubrerythrin
MTKKNNSTQNNPEQKNTQTPQEYIEKIKQNFSKDENDLKKFDETEEKKQIEELNKLKGEVEKDELELNSLLNELEKMEKEESKFCSEFRDL